LILPLALAVGSTLAVSASPARVSLLAPASRTIELRNTGTERVEIELGRRSLDGRGAKEWFSIRPPRVLLPAGGAARVTLRAEARAAQPGDHGILVLVVGRPIATGGVAVRLRLGVPVRVRMPGRIQRRLDVRGLTVRRHKRARDLLVSVANHGNATEQLRGQLTVTLVRRGRVLSRLRPRWPRELYPGMRAVLTLRYTGHIRGGVTAIVRVRAFERRYRLRL
jgi:hypothetical protein